jgi:ATP-binding cassette subfamily F protein 2
MVSASKAAREAKRAADGKAPKKTAASRAKGKDSENASGASSVAGDETPPSSKRQDEIKRLADQMDKHGLSDRVTTGVLSSLKASRDVKITSVSLVFHGRVLIQDATLELTYGRRYGLLGENGCGKSTFLKALDKREFPIPGEKPRFPDSRRMTWTQKTNLVSRIYRYLPAQRRCSPKRFGSTRVGRDRGRK